MKCNVYSVEGNVVESIEVPAVFGTEFRPDLIRRSVLSSHSSRSQPYGPNPHAGKLTSAESLGKNRGIARLPRMKSGPRRGAFVPQTVGGRRAHPPLVEKILHEKINRKERRLALMSAIAVTGKADMVRSRGHRIEAIKEFPLVISDDLEKVRKTKETREIFKLIGVWMTFSGPERRRSEREKARCAGASTRRKRVRSSSYHATRASTSVHGIIPVSISSRSRISPLRISPPERNLEGWSSAPSPP